MSNTSPPIHSYLGYQYINFQYSNVQSLKAALWADLTDLRTKPSPFPGKNWLVTGSPQTVCLGNIATSHIFLVWINFIDFNTGKITQRLVDICIAHPSECSVTTDGELWSYHLLPSHAIQYIVLWSKLYCLSVTWSTALPIYLWMDQCFYLFLNRRW